MKNCGDCGAKPGELHDRGCDCERCRLCGGQFISCGCVYELFVGTDLEDVDRPTKDMWTKYDVEVARHGGRLPWTGEWPGMAEAAEFGFFCRWGPPWITCDKDTPGARPDLNRLVVEAEWDREQGRWVLPNA